MANTLLTPNMITKTAVVLFRNSNAFLQAVPAQYDDQFAIDGARIGTTLRIRLPNDYTVATGPAAQIQDTVEQNTALTVATQKHVDMSFSTQERTMSVDDYTDLMIAPAMNNLAGAVALDIMSGVEGGVCNYVSNVDSSGNVIAPTATTFLNAGATLDTNSAPTMKRMIVNNPYTDARAVSTLSGLLNPATRISDQYIQGTMKNGLGFNWAKDQTVLAHTTGSFTAGTVSGSNQTGLTITTNAITGTLNKGDIITLAAVFQVNRVTKQSTGALRQFVVTANVATGATSIPIYPAIVPASGGQAVQYQTVDASPLNGAAIALVNKANEIYRKNIAFAPDMVTMASADLVLPRGVHEAARSVYDGCSMRLVTDYMVGTDQLITRLDFLYGYTYIRPEFGVVVADAI